MQKLSNSEIFKTMGISNPWWRTGRIAEEYSKMKPRIYLDEFYADIEDRQLRRTLLLLGPRRIGKTVLMYHSIGRLLKSGVKPQNILFISIDNIIYSDMYLQNLVSIFMENFYHKTSDKLYIYFDEIQYLDKWEIQLKNLYDMFINFHFVASGSAASVIQKKSSYGVGRFHNFILPPVSFIEFLNFKIQKLDKKSNFLLRTLILDNAIAGYDLYVNLMQKDKSEDSRAKNFFKEDIKFLNKFFLEYISHGGFPDILSFKGKTFEERKAKIEKDIIEKVLLRDLPELYGVDSNEISKFFKMIAYNMGQEFSYEELHKQSGISKNTIKNYITYLEDAFLVKKISKVDQSSKQFKKETHFKLYLYNPSIRTFLFGEVDKEDTATLGHLIENVVFAQYLQNEGVLQNLYYARWTGGEVDLVVLDDIYQKPKHICEIKWTDKYVKNPVDLKSLKKYIEKSGYYKKINKDNLPIVTTKTIIKKDLYNNIYFVPTALYCLQKSMKNMNDIFNRTAKKLIETSKK